MNADERALVQAAQAARQRAYAPYSRYAVGAALRTPSGAVYTGCNVENASYGLTVCAERVALFAAIAAGERQFDALAVVTANGGAPCGACRQVLNEFASHLHIFIADTAGSVREASLSELLPLGFGPASLPPQP